MLLWCLCRSDSHIQDMSYMSKSSHRSLAYLYNYSGLPYQVSCCAVFDLIHCSEDDVFFYCLCSEAVGGYQGYQPEKYNSSSPIATLLIAEHETGCRIPTDLWNLENSWNFVNLEDSWNFMLDLEFLGIISRFTLKCQEKASECLNYGKVIWQRGYARNPTEGAYSTIFHNSLSTASTLWIHPVHSHYDCIQLCLVAIW